MEQEVWVQVDRVRGPTVQGDLPDPSQVVPRLRGEVSSHRGEGASSRPGEDPSSHQGEGPSSRWGVGVSSLLGEGPSLEEASSLQDEAPSPVAAVLLDPSLGEEALSAPILQAAGAPIHRAVGAPIHRAAEGPTLRAAEGPILQAAVAPIHQAAEGPSLPAEEDPSPVDPCRTEARLPPGAPWGAGSVPLLVPFRATRAKLTLAHELS